MCINLFEEYFSIVNCFTYKFYLCQEFKVVDHLSFLTIFNELRNYAVRVADWLSLFSKDKTTSQYEKSMKNFLVYEAETMEFLEPFFAMRDAEETANYSPIVKDAQVSTLISVKMVP